MKIIKKLSGILTITAIFVLLLTCSAYAIGIEDGDFVIGDFSSADCDVTKWSATSGTHKAENHVSEVTRFGKGKALKWGDMAKTNADGTPQLDASGNTQPKNTKLQSPNFENLSTVLDYDYLYFWIYSDVANGQQMNVFIQDKTTSSYAQQGVSDIYVTIDWTGWKLCQIDISELQYSHFSKSGVSGQATDVWYAFFQCSGWSKYPKVDTLLYVDSIWLSNTDYYAESSELLSIGVPNGAIDVEVSDVVTITGGKEFKNGKSYYNDKITVKKDGIEITDGYEVYCEHNEIYLKFDSTLDGGLEYAIEFASGAVTNDGTNIGGNVLSFTTAIPELEVGAFTFSNGVSSITAPPASGSVTVSVNAKNISDDDKDVVLIVGVFDKTTNYMKAMIPSESITLSSGEDDDFEATVSTDSYENCYIRAFLWESEESMYSYGYCDEI